MINTNRRPRSLKAQSGVTGLGAGRRPGHTPVWADLRPGPSRARWTQRSPWGKVEDPRAQGPRPVGPGVAAKAGSLPSSSSLAAQHGPYARHGPPKPGPVLQRRLAPRVNRLCHCPCCLCPPRGSGSLFVRPSGQLAPRCPAVRAWSSKQPYLLLLQRPPWSRSGHWREL